ncbi:hypothetical protein T265_02506 [Opisthorchis viverrini]|uniref:Uncharacterized protein n=1 Tax=Opisthorchis viverrini TaxID=6198 RepID=A0A075A6E8_OPIVI|nr:hypothetical protein T265_02506 [Opisthorchis viverrini]KER31180.1 hypothetical protein T265_02506 [Opisthorchis viverrini]
MLLFTSPSDRFLQGTKMNKLGIDSSGSKRSKLGYHPMSFTIAWLLQGLDIQYMTELLHHQTQFARGLKVLDHSVVSFKIDFAVASVTKS